MAIFSLLRSKHQSSPPTSTATAHSTHSASVAVDTRNTAHSNTSSPRTPHSPPTPGRVNDLPNFPLPVTPTSRGSPPSVIHEHDHVPEWSVSHTHDGMSPDGMSRHKPQDNPELELRDPFRFMPATLPPMAMFNRSDDVPQMGELPPLAEISRVEELPHLNSVHRRADTHALGEDPRPRMRGSSHSRSRRSTSRQRQRSHVRQARNVMSSSTSRLGDLTEAVPTVGEQHTRELTFRPLPAGSGRGSRDRSLSSTPHRRGNTRERNPWTQAETDDLFRAISKHGIGMWTKIYNDEAYSFSGRSPADIKDRFRTCAPLELLDIYEASTGRAGSRARSRSTQRSIPSMSAPDLSLRQSTGFLDNILNPPVSTRECIDTNTASSPRFSVHILNDTLEESISGSDICDPASPTSPTDGNHSTRCRRVHRYTMQDVMRLGIVEPFKRAVRRERRWFTELDDFHILSGILKWGAQWSRIRNDPAFTRLRERQPTDLRDRIRNKYSDLYVAIGGKSDLLVHTPELKSMILLAGVDDQNVQAALPLGIICHIRTLLVDLHHKIQQKEEGDGLEHLLVVGPVLQGMRHPVFMTMDTGLHIPHDSASQEGYKHIWNMLRAI